MNKVKKAFYMVWLLSLWVIFAPIAKAQWEYKERLAAGRQAMEQRNYAKAHDIFRSLSRRVQVAHPYMPMALLYGAVAAYHLGNYRLAMQDLAACMEHYADWKQPYALRYWMGRVYLKLNHPTQAILQWIRIPHGVWRTAAQQEIQNYLQNIPLDSLRMLQNQYPNEEVFIQTLYQRWNEWPVFQRDSILRQLQEERAHTKKPLPAPKQAYSIALLLPFMYVEDASVHPYRSAAFFTLDFYEGIQMGLRAMTDETPQLILRTYDTKRSQSTTLAILAELAENPPDLILGPLYEEPIAAVQAFSLEHAIPVFNPISLNPGFMATHPLSFLLRGSYAYYHDALVHFVDYNAKRLKLPATAALVYDNHPRSIAMAQDYKKRLDSAHIQLQYEWKVSGQRAKRVYDYLSNAEQVITSDSSILSYADSVFVNSPYTLREGSGQYGEQKEVWFREKWDIPPRALGHLYVITTQPEVLRYAMEAVERRPDTIPLYTQERWLNDPNLDYHQMERTGLGFVTSIEQPKSLSHRRRFQQEYLSYYKHLPSRYSEAGYESIRLLGRLLANCGLYVQHPDCAPTRGVLSAGLAYGAGGENQRVSILRLHKGELQTIYRHTPKR